MIFTDSENLRFSSGFECVIGNPPYLRVQGLREIYETESQFLETKYKSATGRFDFYVLFMERGFSLLNKNGLLSFILPHKFINSDFGTGIRQFIYENKALNFITHFGAEQVFATASVYTCVIGLSHDNKNFKFTQVSPKQISEDVAFEEFDIEKLQDTSRWSFQNSENGNLIEKLNALPLKLKDVYNVCSQGTVSMGDDIYMMKGHFEDKYFIGYSEELKQEIKIEKEIVKPILKGEDVKKWIQPVNSYYVIYPHYLKNGKTCVYSEEEMKSNFPLCYNYLLKFKTQLVEKKIKYKTNPNFWYSLHRAREIVMFEKQKIITPEISLGCNMTIDSNFLYHNTKVYTIELKENVSQNITFYLALLNSKIMWFFLSNTGYTLRGGFFCFKTKYLENFPLPTATESQQQELANLATLMMEAVKKQQDAKSDQEKNICKMRVEAIDTQINAKVYALYGLTEDEIAIVEKSK